jgi:hypothetical protein
MNHAMDVITEQIDIITVLSRTKDRIETQSTLVQALLDEYDLLLSVAE